MVFVTLRTLHGPLKKSNDQPDVSCLVIVERADEFPSIFSYFVVPEKVGLRNPHPESFGKDEGPGRESGC